MGTVRHDLRQGTRSLRRDWLVSAIAAISLSLALGGNATVFSLINSFLFRPLPYPEADRIVLLGEREENAPQTLTASPANFVDWNERNRAFGQLAGFRPGAATVGVGERPFTAASARVSPAFFEILGATPVAGRTFLPEEGELGRHRVALLTDELLSARLADLREPVGAEVLINGEPHTIVGVLPAEFEFFFPNIQVWLPLALDPAALPRDERTIFGVGRLRDGVTMEQARDDMERIWDELVLEYPESNRGWLMDMANFRNEIPNAQGRVLFGLLQGSVIFVLLIACINIANLLSARGQRRQREIALRVVLGAKRWHIVRQLLLESVMLAAVAGAVGIGLAYGAIRAIGTAFATVVPGAWIPALDVRVLAFSLVLTAASGILFGLLPAWQSFRVDLAGTIKEGGRGIGDGASKKLLSRGLVVAEIALSLVLLAGGSMMVQSFLGLRNADPGFDDSNLLTVPLTLPVEDDDSRAAMLAEIESRTESTPGVVAATATRSLPLNIFALNTAFTIEARPTPEGEARPRALWTAAAPDYPEMLGIPLVRGRFFDDADRVDAPPVVVISEALAALHWPDADPIGERIVFRDTSREIVGIVGDTRQTLVSPSGLSADPVVYLPLEQQPSGSVFLMVRAATDPQAVATGLRNELQRVHSQLVIGRMQTLDEIVDQLFVGINVFNVVMTGFGNLALLLAALGTYGVLAYNVAQRRQEIGVRVAVGARHGDVIRMVTRQGIVLGLIGLALGTPFVIMVMRALEFVVQGMPTSVLDPTDALFVGAVLMAATALASLIPAIRATRLDPADVLRDS